MRITEILLETPLDDEELASVGDRAAKFLINRYAKFDADTDASLAWNKTPYDDSDEQMPAFRLINIFPKSKYKFTSAALAQAIQTVSLTAGIMNESGMYFFETKRIVINLERLDDAAGTASIIVHELRHSMDRGLTKRPTPAPVPMAGDNQPLHQVDFKKYLQLTTEVNARYSQVIYKLRQFMLTHPNVKNMGATDYKWFIRDMFKAEHMDTAFELGIADPRYKRLFKRTYLWMTQYFADRMQTPGGVNQTEIDK